MLVHLACPPDQHRDLLLRAQNRIVRNMPRRLEEPGRVLQRLPTVLLSPRSLASRAFSLQEAKPHRMKNLSQKCSPCTRDSWSIYLISEDPSVPVLSVVHGCTIWPLMKNERSKETDALGSRTGLYCANALTTLGLLPDAINVPSNSDRRQHSIIRTPKHSPSLSFSRHGSHSHGFSETLHVRMLKV